MNTEVYAVIRRIAQIFTSLVEDILKTIQFNAQTLLLYKKILEKLFDKEDIIRRSEIKKVNEKIDKMDQRKSNLQDKYLDDEIDGSNYNDMMDKITKETVSLKNTLHGLKNEMTPFRNYVNDTLPMLENIVEYYRKTDGKTKKKILGCIFAEKLVLEKGKVATTPFTIPVQVLLNSIKGFERSQKKQEVDFDPLSTMAPHLGLEPRTL